MPSSKKKLSFSLSRLKVKKIFRSIKSPFRKDDRVKDGPATTPVVDQSVQDGVREDSEELGVDKQIVIHHREQTPPASNDDNSSTLLSDVESDSSSRSEIYFDAQETILDHSDQEVAVRDDETEPMSNMTTQHDQASIPGKEKAKEMTKIDTGLDQQQQHDAHPTLQKLAPELIIEIMLLLPHSSPYLLQQTCQKFRQLSKRDTFKTFNLEFRDGPESYCISENGYQQRKVIRDILARRTLCQECNAHRDSGKLLEVMHKLYELQHCHGCKASHPALFFSPEEKGKQYTQCLGRIGNFPLCSHKSFAGPDMVTLSNIGGKEGSITCEDSSHKLTPDSLFKTSYEPGGFLDIALALDSGPMKYYLYFVLRTTIHLVVLDGCSDKHLEMRRNIVLKTFLHPSWLFNLNYNQDKDCDSRLKRNPLLDEEMKHILWCDNSGCATGSERRWEKMALLYLNDAFNKGALHDGNYGNDARARDMAWLSLEYDVFNGLAA
ncbi:hypothetical protein FPCIR_7222 [Fusarium pseudocircinatum]|uniref:F-box domain-containing protein n=1 Tax=Fusarium pseudocircinatum TaxID=56676 RepID=A0A8H5P3B1_9HYPO|nr:hypothetical protein FPCIR_7222 [Fusarium pseudocircinatum]